MQQLYIVLKGTSDLLQHNIQAMRTADDAIPKPEEEAELGCYRLPDGNLCHPAAAVRNALIKASSGRFVQDIRTNRKIRVTPLISGAVLFADDMFPLIDDQSNPIKDYAVDIRSVKNPTTGGRHLRARARIRMPWYLVCTFRFTENLVSLDVVEDLLNTAGSTVGIGDFRFEKKGPFGGFVVALIELRSLGDNMPPEDRPDK